MSIIITQYAQCSATKEVLGLETGLKKQQIGAHQEWGGRLCAEEEERLQILLSENPTYKKLDRSVQLALLASNKLLPINKEVNLGVNIGSSRGATHLLEASLEQYLREGKLPVLTSPTTSLGNLSSWVGQHLGAKTGAMFSHSMTCSTSLLSLLNGMAWLESGMADEMLVGGAEAPLTPFTIAQSKAIRIYSREKEIPSLAGKKDKVSNAMVLGEAAGLLHLKKVGKKNKEKRLAEIAGVGYAAEPLPSITGISNKAEHLQQSMKEALKQADMQSVDVVVSHTPGTLKGDKAEYLGIEQVFGEEKPLITNNKWRIGHTFGAAGVMSLIFAIEMLQQQKFVPLAFTKKPIIKKKIESILINAAGFGGNAVSIILKK